MSRSRLQRRPSRIVPASVVAVVLLAIGVLTATAAIARLVTGSWPTEVTAPAGQLAGLTWGSSTVVVTGAVIAGVGLMLLIAGLKPGGYATATLGHPDGGSVAETDYVISTRAIARLAASQADTVDGVDKVSASASSRRVHLRITTSSEQIREIGDRVRAAVADRISAAGVSPAPRVTTSVRTKGI